MKTDKDLSQMFKDKSLDWKNTGYDTKYAIKETADEFIIAFYGSNSKEDWMNNLRIWKKPYKRMKVPFYVHAGFLRVWKEIEDYFLDLVKGVTKPITITGHSYGAGVGTLFTEAIWFHYPEKRKSLKLTTFGCPRVVSWWNFIKIKERWESHTRYVNGTDPIPHVPFFLFGYIHTAKETHIGDKKSIFKIFNAINYHDIRNYTKSLEKLDG